MFIVVIDHENVKIKSIIECLAAPLELEIYREMCQNGGQFEKLFKKHRLRICTTCNFLYANHYEPLVLLTLK